MPRARSGSSSEMDVIARRHSNTFRRDDEGSVPNLDAMSHRELMDFWMKYQNRQKRKDAEALVGRRKDYTKLAAKLGAYAANKAAALSCRESGNAHGESVYEKICEIIYNELPADLRW